MVSIARAIRGAVSSPATGEGRFAALARAVAALPAGLAFAAERAVREGFLLGFFDIFRVPDAAPLKASASRRNPARARGGTTPSRRCN
jgi:hypothetical protein